MTSHGSPSKTLSTGSGPGSISSLDLWARRIAAGLVAAVAAYGSYEHQRAFALQGGADTTSAGLWPFSVDGLLVLATVGLLKSSHHTDRRIRLAAWLAFGLGIAVSLAANIASAPTLAWQPVLVAGWPPVALLLAVELLAHRSHHREHAETERVVGLAAARGKEGPARRATAEDLMWDYYQSETSRGRVPTGAELDRVAGTNNFGRRVLRRWREAGRIPDVAVLNRQHRDTETTESARSELIS
jgi:Protein of unknown function (DUF2637)